MRTAPSIPNPSSKPKGFHSKGVFALVAVFVCVALFASACKSQQLISESVGVDAAVIASPEPEPTVATEASFDPTPAPDEQEALAPLDTDELDNKDSAENSGSGGDTDNGESASQNAGDSEGEMANPHGVERVAEPGAFFVLEGDLDLSVDAINDMVTFVEEAAGREFRYPPKIVVQSVADYEAGLELDDEDREEFQQDLDETHRYLAALGLTELGQKELGDNVLALLSDSEGVLGYYDPDVDELFLPGNGEVTKAFQATLVHELLHALDGQYADLAALLDEMSADDTPADESFARRSILEGRAVSVESLWSRQNNYLAIGNEAPESYESVPAALIFSLIFPYFFGEIFITNLGGTADTWDEVTTDNPPTSEEILQGKRLDEPVVDVATPGIDGAPVDVDPTVQYEDTFGAIDLFLMFGGESLDADPSVFAKAARLTDGWAGGRHVLWGDNEVSCIRAALAADTEGDFKEIENALTDWANEGEARSYSSYTDDQDNAIAVFTSCVPHID